GCTRRKGRNRHAPADERADRTRLDHARNPLVETPALARGNQAADAGLAGTAEAAVTGFSPPTRPAPSQTSGAGRAVNLSETGYLVFRLPVAGAAVRFFAAAARRGVAVRVVLPRPVPASSSMRLRNASTSSRVGTPSRPSALDTRSSNTFSSRSHVSWLRSRICPSVCSTLPRASFTFASVNLRVFASSAAPSRT